jgi:hypothetical protein
MSGSLSRRKERQKPSEPPESLSDLQRQAKKSGADKLTLEEIEKEIDEVRRYKNKERV